MVNETIILDDWKGKSGTEITTGHDIYTVIEYRKNKNTTEAKTVETLVMKEHVDILLNIIKNNCIPGEKYGYRFIIRKLIEHYNFHTIYGMNIDTMMECFNGGKYRKLCYFRYYYYPIKVIEYLRNITYHGDGSVTYNK